MLECIHFLFRKTLPNNISVSQMAFDKCTVHTVKLGLCNKKFQFFSDFRPPLIFPFNLPNLSSQFSLSCTITPNDLVFATYFIPESIKCSCFEISTLFVLRGWSIIMYSVFLGVLALFVYPPQF